MSDQLPANPMADFATRATEHRRPVQRLDGGFLRFNGKSGQWSMGQEEVPVDGEEVIINSPSMMHGYQRWGEVPPAKAFTSVAQPLPAAPEPIDGVDQDGRECTFTARDARQVGGKFVEEDLGQFIFNTDSMGGVERMDELFDAIITKSQDGTPYCFPLVTLESDFYKRSTGKVYKPIFKIVSWCDMDGKPEKVTQKLVDDTPAEEAPTRRRRRRA